ncbi:MAG TPA: IS66 family insertion sequence element accessory protein TnpB [Chlamydiales bacterium]|nr:IS66 family insertion sequence element accessory protein TnpB [Chlamydiales bacterium]
MLALPGNARLFLCQTPVNMRKSFEGLSALVTALFPNELFSGAFFIFLNKGKDHMKVLFWDHDGFVIFYKRLEQGSFAWKWGDTQTLDRRTFVMLLEGVIPKRLQHRFSL